MGTRSNFYKNPSYAYNKDLNLNSALQNLQAYNLATGNLPPPTTQEFAEIPGENFVAGRRKRRREHWKPPEQNTHLQDYDDQPMSHQDYIKKRRRELKFCQVLEELPASVLCCGDDDGLIVIQGTSNTGVPLVEYETDRVKNRSEQRFPVPGEPACILCGKYGEYICDETNDDVCSIDCKAELLENIKREKVLSRNLTAEKSSPGLNCPTKLYEFGGDTWNHKNHRWSAKKSSLCTYRCWKCQRPGHLADDCLAVASIFQAASSGETCSQPQVTLFQKKSGFIPRDLSELYKRCHQYSRNEDAARCNSCNNSSDLATCLECNITCCDSVGHLSEHIKMHPSHKQYYSHKLKHLVKCCKSNCKVTDIKDLLACHYCFNKAFDKFYDMYTATWKAAGLSIIRGSICCEDHFEWHRINCLNADVEGSAYIYKKDVHSSKRSPLSDFIF
ncbi:uncharacterized protein LOC108205978 isoform X3 [Daucus carota subsp. sativus]|uniref:uncharacterized protein LOC108205978 isoform X3 n=1 Tax=Daucus carota subsp. sativus TaxID=79200 RepID=UPI003082B250